MDAADIANLSIKVERYLRENGGWVHGSVICAVFGVRERLLRAAENRPGLCTSFAISGKKGFRHVETCTAEEFSQFVLQINNHAQSERDRVFTLTRRRELAGAKLEQGILL